MKRATPTMTRATEPVESKDVVMGETYTDSVTGIKGVATAVYLYLTGCDQVCLTSVESGEAKHHVVDATRLAELRKPQETPLAVVRAGGPDGSRGAKR